MTLHQKSTFFCVLLDKNVLPTKERSIFSGMIGMCYKKILVISVPALTKWSIVCVSSLLRYFSEVVTMRVSDSGNEVSEENLVDVNLENKKRKQH